MAVYEMSWESPAGEFLDIGLDSQSSQGFWLESVDGFSSAVDVDSVVAPSSVGEIDAGSSIPAISGTLSLVLAPEMASRSMMGLPELWTMLKRSFSQIMNGTLRLTQRDGQVLSCSMRLAKPIPAPEWNPHSSGVKVLQTDVDLTGRAGVWFGMPDEGGPTADGGRMFINSGDITEHLQVSWSGSGCSLTVGGWPTVQLPDVEGEHHLSTDPGDGFRIMNADGRVDVGAWASMRGRPVPGSVIPGGQVTVHTEGNVTVTLRPRFLDPWR